MGYPESFNELEQWRDALRTSLSGEAVIHAIEARIAGESDPDRLQILDHLLAQEHAAQGNHEAARAIRARRPDQEIYRWHDAWRESHRDGDVVAALEQKIASETHPQKLHVLRSILADEHRRRRDYLAAEAVNLADAAANPDNPRPLIALATQKFCDEDLLDEAMRYADRAVAAAMRSGLFRREALGVKARIAEQLADYRMIEDILRQIMALIVTRGHVDTGAERDFFDRLPSGSIDPDLASAYHDYCSARGRRHTATYAQIDGFILAAARPQWRKVAWIVAVVLKDCERGELASDEYVIGARVEALVVDGKLELQGNVKRWRHSEVRLADVPVSADGETLTPARTGAESDASRIIAGRVLIMKVGRRDVEVPVTVYAPANKGDHWRCDVAIGWPDKPRHMHTATASMPRRRC